MAILIVGLILFLGVHTVRIAAPGWRDGALARIGEGPYKGLHAVLSLAGLVLIISGFSMASAEAVFLYAALPPLRTVAAILTALALVLAVASVLPAGRIKRAVRHPLLIATTIWAVAHLLVNGDLAGVVLFGAFLVWAVFHLILETWQPAPVAATPRSDLIAVVAGLALYGILVWRLHFWLFGVSPLV